jgi:hypothetical protein
MRVFRSSVAALLLFTLGSLAGCSDSTGPDGRFGSLDTREVRDALTNAFVPVLAPFQANQALGGAATDLEAMGVTFDPAQSLPPTAFLTRPDLAALPVIAAVDFPAGVLGETFVYDELNETWVADPAQTDAPANGIRIIWYRLDTSGDFLLPLEELGYIDLFDQDGTDGVSRLRVLIYSAVEDLVIADYVQTFSRTGTTQWTQRATVNGFIANQTDQLDVQIVSDMSGDDDTGDESFSIDLDVGFTGGSYELLVSGDVDGADQTYSDFTRVTANLASGTTALDLETTGVLDGLADGSGSITHNGSLISTINVQNGRLSFLDSDGDTYSDAASAQLQGMLGTMILVGYDVLVSFPLLGPALSPTD